VLYKDRKPLNFPECADHADEQCKHYCEKCNIPVCLTCISGKHKEHDISDILETLSTKTESVRKDLEELETRIYLHYEKMTCNIQAEKAELQKHYNKLTTEADQRGEIWHQEITAIVNQRKEEIEEMKREHLSAVNKNIDEITQKFTELKYLISDF
jgi:Skp family chaperone for outer membrane proteins